MQLEPGMRVRCVSDNGAKRHLTKGMEYAVTTRRGSYVAVNGGVVAGWHVSRFKPIVRVKAISVRVPPARWPWLGGAVVSA